MTDATITLLILAAAAALFITEIIPLPATAMSAAVALYLTGVLPAAAALGGLVNSNVILIASMFVIGAAIFETGLAHKLGDAVVRVAGQKEKSLLIAMMTVAAAMSAVTSNTATTAVLLPVALRLADQARLARGRLLMPLAVAAGLGGMITLVGTPPNLLARGALEAANLGTFGFFEFAKIGIPLTVVGILYMTTVGSRLLPHGTESTCRGEAAQELATAGAFSPAKQWIAGLVMAGTMVVIVFERQVGVPLHITAVTGALVLVVTRVLSERQVYDAIDWTTIFLFAGMLPVASALDTTGAGRKIAGAVIAAIGQEAGPFLLTAALFALSAGLTQFMSNTAATALLAPIGIAIAKDLGVDPRAVVMAIAIAASCAFATPIGTPPNALVLGPGNFRFKDYVRVGTPLVLLLTAVSVILLPMLWPF
jgi:anion transporter